MKKILLIITLAFLVSGCHTLFMYDAPTGFTKYNTHTIIVDTYYPYYYSYYWYKPHKSYYYNNHYVKPYNNGYKHFGNKKEVKRTIERTKEKIGIRNNSGNRNKPTRKR